MSYQQLPVQMHNRYAEFLAFMTECPHRKTPSTMETAFWAWLKTKKEQNDDDQLSALKRDLNIKHRECAERERQVLVMAEEVERLNDELTRIKSIIAGFLHGGAVGDRGKACMAIDGGNL